MRPFTPLRRALLPLIGRLAPPRRFPLPFVLLSTQRSGSTWLLDQLHAHPRVFAHAELFLNDGEGLPRFAGDGELPFFNTWIAQAETGRTWNARRHALHDYLDLAFAAREGVEAAGFKLMYSQLRRVPDLLAHLAWRRVKLVHLIRRNLLDVYLSRKAREVRGFAHAREGEAVEEVKLEIDGGDLERYLRRATREHEVYRAQLDRIGFERCEIHYESLVADDTILERALRFLGQEPAARTSQGTFRKLAKRSRREQIVNVDEVARVLQRLGLEAMLDDEWSASEASGSVR